MPTSHEDDLDWDEWMSLTDQQQDAIVEREVRDYYRAYDALSLSKQIAHRRRWTLDSCRRSRRTLALPGCTSVLREYVQASLKRSQLRLLKVRIWRATGTYPGEA